MNDYVPRAGSIAAKAVAYLKEHGETATAPLADAIDCENNALLASLEYALRNGAIKVRKHNGLNWFSLGDGTALKSRAPDDDANPLVQRRVPATTQTRELPEVPVFLAETRGSFKGDPPPIVMDWKSPPIMVQPAFSCGLFSDGRFVIEFGEQKIELAREYTEQLIRFIERLAPEAAA